MTCHTAGWDTYEPCSLLRRGYFLPRIPLRTKEVVDLTDCPQLGQDGKCRGLYFGFTCIKDKCKMQNKEAACPHCIGGDYCLKFNRFGCIGPDNCGTMEDYLTFIRKARDKALI